MQVELRQAGVRHGPGAAALAPLDLRLEPGEHLAVIGPSGAGKTTLLHLLACSLRPTGGALALDGQDPWTLPSRALQRLRGGLFLAPQVPPLPPRQRVVTAVLAGRLPHQGLLASLRSLVYPDDLPGAASALAAFDLADKLFERVDRLSGGERQRVGLARALVAQVQLLLVDEPLSALDPARSAQALSTLCEAARGRGATLVATLHDVPAALRHFPRVLGLREGRAAFDLPARDVTAAHLQALYEGEGEGSLAPPPVDADASGPSRLPLVCR